MSAQKAMVIRFEKIVTQVLMNLKDEEKKIKDPDSDIDFMKKQISTLKVISRLRKAAIEGSLYWDDVNKLKEACGIEEEL